MATVVGLGDIGANSIGAYLYQTSLAPTGGGGLPFGVAAALLFVSSASLRWFLPHSGRLDEARHSPADSPAGEYGAGYGTLRSPDEKKRLRPGRSDESGASDSSS